MNIARLNFSHGDYDYHAATIANVREAVSRVGDLRIIGIALDTKGPEIRTGVLASVSESSLCLIRFLEGCSLFRKPRKSS